MRTKLAVGVAGMSLVLAGTAVSVSAHHAFAAEFDSTKPITFKGKVTRMEWVNPHVWIHISVAKPDATTEEWMVEGGAPTVLFRRGFTKTALLPGTEIVVDGYQAKDGTHKMNGRDVTLTDGRKLFFSAPNAGVPDK